MLQPDQIPASSGPADAHGMDPLAVFGHLAAIGGDPVPTLIVGCEPAALEEEMGLSTPVEASVDQAVGIVSRTARRPGRGRPHPHAGDRRMTRRNR